MCEEDLPRATPCSAAATQLGGGGGEGGEGRTTVQNWFQLSCVELWSWLVCRHSHQTNIHTHHQLYTLCTIKTIRRLLGSQSLNC